ncbi:ABC transporter permease [Noviherbaspirillum sp.]|uniref:ABC transporter permease n=1 Tax=Noviherbaspirillum sp. TaxID=1926288 RepID=UPI002B492C94|nr:ABC transporter permease [Noviherbaspirillum sp.]HJV82377.1 ABC transporter permease [Noviherbaspirillum sp.]
MRNETVVIARPEFRRDTNVTKDITVVEQPRPLWEKIWDHAMFRKALVLLVLAAVWEVYARSINQPLLFPTCGDTMSALYSGVLSGEIPARVWYSIKLLLQGYAIGMVLAALMTAFAISTRIGTDLLETLTSMFNPLPAIALLPLALIWFGLSNGSVIFVLVHSVLWPVALNMHSGFMSVSPTLRMVGRNYGLNGLGLVTKILMPAAFASILTGLKIGWAFAWRTLIAAELVFGASSGSGGLGWFIYENKNLLEITNVFAGLFTVILIGLFIEGVLFKGLERKTIRKWGMQS